MRYGVEQNDRLVVDGRDQVLAGGMVVACFTEGKPFNHICLLDLGLGDPKKILDERRVIAKSKTLGKFLQVAPDLCVFDVESRNIETISFTLEKLPKAFEVWFHTMAYHAPSNHQLL